LAVLYKEQKRYEEAEKLLLEAVKGCRLKLGDTHPRTLESMNNLITLYEAWNKPESVCKWLFDVFVILRWRFLRSNSLITSEYW
jgi:hypothetical protein